MSLDAGYCGNGLDLDGLDADSEGAGCWIGRGRGLGRQLDWTLKRAAAGLDGLRHVAGWIADGLRRRSKAQLA